MKKPLSYKLMRPWFFYLKRQETKTIYRVAGLRRSGNHAVLNWMLAQMPGLTCFNNNQQNHPPENTGLKRAVMHGTGRYNLVIGHEDQPLEIFTAPLKRSWYGGMKRHFDVLILRDPYNWLASRYAWQEELGQRFREDENYRQQLIAQYKAYARLFGEWQKAGWPEKIALNYNRWAVEREYRRALAKRLDLRFTDRGRDKVSIHGQGSSFDGQKYHGRGSEMPVLERWQQFQDDPFFRNLFDEELKEVGERFFGMSYDVKFL